MPEDIRMTTPENIEIRFELAGLATRTRAFFYDCLYQLILAIGILWVSLTIAPRYSPYYDLVMPLSIGLNFLVFWGYHILFETLMDGQTPGKRHFGLRVVTLDGQKIEFFPSMVRNLGRIVDFLPVGFLVGVVTILASQYQQRIGDLFSRTVVIREAPAGATPSLPAAPTLTSPPPPSRKAPRSNHDRQRL